MVNKFLVKLLKYRIMFKDILTLLGFDYRVDSIQLFVAFIKLKISKRK